MLRSIGTLLWRQLPHAVLSPAPAAAAAQRRRQLHFTPVCCAPPPAAAAPAKPAPIPPVKRITRGEGCREHGWTVQSSGQAALDRCKHFMPPIVRPTSALPPPLCPCCSLRRRRHPVCTQLRRRRAEREQGAQRCDPLTAFCLDSAGGGGIARRRSGEWSAYGRQSCEAGSSGAGGQNVHKSRAAPRGGLSHSALTRHSWLACAALRCTRADRKTRSFLQRSPAFLLPATHPHHTTRTAAAAAASPLPVLPTPLLLLLPHHNRLVAAAAHIPSGQHQGGHAVAAGCGGLAGRRNQGGGAARGGCWHRACCSPTRKDPFIVFLFGNEWEAVRRTAPRRVWGSMQRLPGDGSKAAFVRLFYRAPPLRPGQQGLAVPAASWHRLVATPLPAASCLPPSPTACPPATAWPRVHAQERKRINKEGELVIQSQRTRSQACVGTAAALPHNLGLLGCWGASRGDVGDAVRKLQLIACMLPGSQRSNHPPTQPRARPCSHAFNTCSNDVEDAVQMLQLGSCYVAWKSLEDPLAHPPTLFSCLQCLQRQRGGCFGEAAGDLGCCLEGGAADRGGPRKEKGGCPAPVLPSCIR